MSATAPIIILGASRSGTRLLRALLAAHPEVVAVPHDVNFIWKHGNYRIDHDELTPAHATPEVIAFVRRFVERAARGHHGCRVVEKTVANTVRVGFVRRIFPDCRLVHIIRDGRDVAASAARQWRAPMDWAGVLPKLWDLPLAAAPTYALDYVRGYLRRALSKDRRVSSWGVRIENLGQLLQRHSVLEVAGIQWARCVDHSQRSLAMLPPQDWLEVRYERLVEAPTRECRRIFAFLALDPIDPLATDAAPRVSTAMLARWRDQLSEAELTSLMPHIEATMIRLGYLPALATA